MGEAGQRVGLVHELAQLGGPEELLDGRHDRADVDQALRRDRLRILGGHALADHPLETGQTHTHLILDQLADGADAPVAEVIDIVGTNRDLGAAGERDRTLPGMQGHQVSNRVDDVIVAEQLQTFGPVVIGHRVAELLVELVPADPGEVVALGVLEQRLDETAGRLDGGRLTGPQLAVQVEQRFLTVVRGVALERVADRLGAVEQLEDLLVGLGDTERTQEGTDVLAALAIDAHTDGVALVGVELQPGAPTGNDLTGEDVAVGGLVATLIEVDAGRTNELADDDSLGSVDDEHAVLGHHREIAEEDRLFLDLTGLTIDEPGGHEQRTGVVGIPLLALFDGHHRITKAVIGEFECEGTGEVLDR